MKLLIITDSLGLPRPTPEVVNYNQTWCSLISDRFKTHQLSIGGATIVDLKSQINYLKMYEPDLIVVQCGIVDCAPRALTKYESYVLNKYSFTRKLLKWCSPWILKLLRKRGRTYTNEVSFRGVVKKFRIEFGEKMYWIGIVPSAKEYEVKVPGVSENIKKYNKILKEELGTNLLDVSEMLPEHIMSDFHHLNVAGHKYIAEKLIYELV